MQSLLLSIISLSFLLTSNSSWNSKINNREKEDFVNNLASQYCTSGKIIAANASMKIGAITKSNRICDLIMSFPTYIHENYHSYNSQLTSKAGWVNRKFFIQPGLVLTVPETKVFNSIKLNKIVTKSLRDKIFRYSTYIGEKDKLGYLDSQESGIYGLLEEFAAYYHGSNAIMELSTYMIENYKKTDLEPWLDYLTQPTSSFYALYEFQLFFSWYLQYAKTYEADMYKQIINNTSFKLAYSLIASKYEKVLKHYFSLRTEVLNSSKKRFDLRDEFLYVDEDGDGWHERGQGVPDDDINFLQNEMAKPEHIILSEIRMNESEILLALEKIRE